MRPEVRALIVLGPFPSEESASPEQIEKYQVAVESIACPVSDEEARSLIKVFGEDGCFGLAWSLLHLIETSPGWPLADVLTNSDNEWIARLRERAARSSLL